MHVNLVRKEYSKRKKNYLKGPLSKYKGPLLVLTEPVDSLAPK